MRSEKLLQTLIDKSPSHTDTMLYLLLDYGEVPFNLARSEGVNNPTMAVRRLRERGWVIDSIAKEVYKIKL